MDALRELSLFTVKIGGVSFKMRRRVTRLMLQLGNPQRVFGLIAGANKGEEIEIEKIEAAKVEYVEMAENCLRIALVEVDGEPVDLTLAKTREEVYPLSDVLFKAFLDSGLALDPSPESSKGKTGSK